MTTKIERDGDTLKMTRVFDALRAAVFEAYPEIVSAGWQSAIAKLGEVVEQVGAAS